jgi:hypothetical protein
LPNLAPFKPHSSPIQAPFKPHSSLDKGWHHEAI